ncbi:PfkB family carbohydrate kinase [Ciceribacter sp. L1K22]|uniref:carbohydrate kinase family protein n=1 Tax=Ciceribacter sp. L1K22 TaxID=2820275 RepID=UPI001ABDE6D6|nr:carbohydrate kinase family protein [Ciceribacter sp. L1K22]
MSGPLVVFGGAHIDRRGRIEADTVMGASNPGHFMSEAGGGAFNAARALARLGHSVRLVAPRGGDAAGEIVTHAAAEAGIDDRPFVFLDRETPSYTAILDRDGGLVIALADMELYRLFSPRRLRTLSVRAALADAGAILCDANLPAETLEALAATGRQRGLPVGAIAISPAKVVRFRAALPHLDWLCMNVAEARALSGADAASAGDWATILRGLGLAGGLVTNGMHPVVAFDREGIAILTPPRLDRVADVTGAGDATAAGFLSARLAGIPLGEALRRGVAAALVTLKTDSATATNLSPDQLNANLPLVPAAQMLS